MTKTKPCGTCSGRGYTEQTVPDHTMSAAFGLLLGGGYQSRTKIERIPCTRCAGSGTLTFEPAPEAPNAVRRPKEFARDKRWNARQDAYNQERMQQIRIADENDRA